MLKVKTWIFSVSVVLAAAACSPLISEPDGLAPGRGGGFELAGEDATPTVRLETAVAAATSTATPGSPASPEHSATPGVTAPSPGLESEGLDRPDSGPSEAQQRLLADLENHGAAPELHNQVWLNSEPLKLADLRGQVAIVEFWTFG